MSIRQDIGSLYAGTPPGTVAKANGEPLDPRLDLANKSPTGFAWGYLGSGPAQLALAILADFADDETALRYYQGFKALVISGLERNREWTLDAEQIEFALRYLRTRDNETVLKNNGEKTMNTEINTDWPIISASEAQDERADGVYLLDGDQEGKITAQDMGEYWYIRDWEPYVHDGVLCWLDRSGYSLTKNMIKALYVLQS